jgi:hypothetical protein
MAKFTSLFTHLPHFNFGTKNPVQNAGAKAPVLKLIFFIIDWDRKREANTVLAASRVRYHYMTRARGTASSDILDLLGIGASDTALSICLEQEAIVPLVLRDLRRKLGAKATGTGIAFTVPLSGINTPLLAAFQERKIAMEENVKREKKIEIKSDLIVVVMNQGFSDELMATAKEKGARGGTVISARGLSAGGAVKFFGVSVQEEKEILLILTGREQKTAIMEALSDKHGPTSKAGAIIFSLPVDQVMSLNLLSQ